MMNILHVNCSPRGQASESYRLSMEMIARLRLQHPTPEIVERWIGGGNLLPIDEDYALSQQSSADVAGTGSAARSADLIQELDRADAVVIATPMHNYAVPAALKLWIDHIARVRRTFDVGAQGKVALLRDRPVLVAVSSGGRFSGEGARQPDFLTPYLKAILGMIGLRDVSFFSVEGVAFGPAALADARARASLALERHFDDQSREGGPSAPGSVGSSLCARS